jgi:ribonuclease P protein component
MSFGAADRLHRSAEFIQLQRHGIRYQSPHFVMYAGKIRPFDKLRAGSEQGRRSVANSVRTPLGVTVSSRIGGAVVRNRLKRRIRETFRTAIRQLFPTGVSVVVIARRGADRLASAAIQSELVAAARIAAAKLETAPK